MESRRGARVTTTFLVAIDGIDAEPTLRKGDISATGVYFETRREIGGVGTIHWLHLVAADRARRVRVMAYVVRTVQLADVGGDRVGGVAFEFMPESDDAQATLQDFVLYVLALRAGKLEPHIEPRLAAKVDDDDDDPKSATVRQLSVRSMVLETSWAIAPGEKVRVDIVAPGMTRRIRLEGKAVRVAPKTTRASKAYDIEVEVQAEQERPLRTHSSMAFQAVRAEQIAAAAQTAASRESALPREDEDVSRVLDDLLSALILPPDQDAPRDRREMLSGKIEQVRLPTLFALFEMERMTGRLVVQRGAEHASVFVRDGQLVDVEPLDGAETRRSKLGALVAWETGTFELHAEPVERVDRIHLKTTALLLEIAREVDEARARGGA